MVKKVIYFGLLTSNGECYHDILIGEALKAGI